MICVFYEKKSSSSFLWQHLLYYRLALKVFLKIQIGLVKRCWKFLSSTKKEITFNHEIYILLFFDCFENQRRGWQYMYDSEVNEEDQRCFIHLCGKYIVYIFTKLLWAMFKALVVEIWGVGIPPLLLHTFLLWPLGIVLDWVSSLDKGNIFKIISIWQECLNPYNCVQIIYTMNSHLMI